MAENEINGESVYTEKNIDQKERHILYRAVRGLVRKYTDPGETIMDIGVSDLPASRRLLPDYPVIGLDLSFDALQKARNNTEHPERTHLFQADVTSPPFKNLNGVKTFLALDVLEHITEDQAVDFLVHIKDHADPEHTIIATMPNISWKTPAHAFEYGRRQILKIRGSEPKTGLYDRTHQILTDTEGHKEMFRKAGYEVVEEYGTRVDQGISDTIEGVEPVTHTDLSRRSIKIATGLVARLRHPIDQQKRQQFEKDLSTYQGMYVLKPSHIK